LVAAFFILNQHLSYQPVAFFSLLLQKFAEALETKEEKFFSFGEKRKCEFFNCSYFECNQSLLSTHSFVSPWF